MNNEVVRVLVTSPLGVGGVTNMMIHIQEHLDRSKINFDYLVFHDRHEPMEDKVLSLGSKKYVASADNVKFRPFRRIWRINEIRKVCKKNHIKILHYNADCAADMTNIIGAKLGGVQYITIHSHNAGFGAAGNGIRFGTMIFGSYALTKKRRSDYLLFLISVAALLLSGKRAHTVFGLAALYLCYFAYNSNAKKSRLVKGIGVLLGALTVFAVASYCVPALATVVFRFIDTAETGDMSVGRVDVWLKAFSMFGKHSLVGIGWGQYVNQGGWFWNIHNIYIQLLVETGIIGFIIYCGWFLFHLVRTWSMYSKMRVNPEDYTNIDYCLMNFSLAMQIFFILYGFTGNPLYDREMFVPYFIACAISVNYANNDDGSELE